MALFPKRSCQVYTQGKAVRIPARGGAAAPFARGAELGLLEASWTEAPGGSGHLSAAQAAEFAARAGLKRLLLTHFYQPVSRRRVRAQVRRVFRGPLLLARDLRTRPLGRRRAFL